MSLRKYLKPWGAAGVPNYFFLLLLPPPKAAPQVPLPQGGESNPAEGGCFASIFIDRYYYHILDNDLYSSVRNQNKVFHITAAEFRSYFETIHLITQQNITKINETIK